MVSRALVRANVALLCAAALPVFAPAGAQTRIVEVGRPGFTSKILVTDNNGLSDGRPATEDQRETCLERKSNGRLECHSRAGWEQLARKMAEKQKAASR
jgi:hypothetical protein